jgi:MFS family permease
MEPMAKIESAGLRAWPIVAAFAVLMLFFASEGVSSAVISPYFQSSGYPLADIGALVGAFSVASLASRLPAGLYYRGARARLLLVGSAAALACGDLLYLVPAAALPARLIVGFAFGVGTTVNFAQFLGLVAALPRDRTRAIAYFTALQAAGFSGGTLVGGAVGDQFGYAPTFGLAAALATVAGLVAAASPAPPPPPAGATPLLRGRAGLRRLLNAAVLDAPILACLLNAINFFQSAFLPLYALSVGISLTGIGTIRATHALANAVTRPFLAGPAARLGQRGLGVAGLVAVAAVSMLVPSFPSLLGLTGLMVPLGLARAAVFLTTSVATAENAERHGVSRGLAAGLLNVGLDLGAILGPVIGGLIAAQIGLEPTFRALPPLLLAVYLGWLLLARSHTRV